MLQLKTGTQKRENLNKEATKLNLELKYKSNKKEYISNESAICEERDI